MQYTALMQVTRWDLQDHFSPVGRPGNGDTIVCPPNVEQLVVRGSQVIGTSEPSGTTDAITFQNSDAMLLMDDGCHLTYKGTIRLRSGTAPGSSVTFHPGSTLWHDSTGAPDPANTHYPVVLGDVASAFCFVDFSGSADPQMRVTIGSEAGGGQGWFESELLMTGGCFCLGNSGHVDHVRWGNATNYGYTAAWGVQSHTLFWRNMTFTDCGGIRIKGIKTPGECELDNLNFDGTLTPYDVYSEQSAALPTNALVNNCVFGKRFFMFHPSVEITNCVFGNRGPTLNAGVPVFDTNVIIKYEAPAWSGIRSGTNVAMINYHSQGNPHGWQLPVGTCSVDGYVFIYTGPPASDAGDAIVTNAASVATIRRALVLDSRDNAATNTLFSLLGTVGTSITLANCTCVGHGVYLGEGGYAGHTDILAQVKDCLFPNFGSATRHKIRDLNGSVLNPITPANAHHNGGYGLAAGSNQNGYDGMNLNPDNGTIGASDVDANPQFKIRMYLEEWDTSVGGVGSADDAVAGLLAFNRPGGNPAYSPAAFIDAFLGDNDNWAPTAEAYNGTASDGGTIGAKTYKAPAPVATVPGTFSPFGPGVFQ